MSVERADVPPEPTMATHSSMDRIPGLPTNTSGSKAASPELDISIVIPVFNSAATLEELVERISGMAVALAASHEIILIDDDSQDDSWKVIRSLGQRDRAHVMGVQLMRNYGQHNALMCGLAMARGKLIVTMDDDLQNPPEEVPKMIAHLAQHRLDLVYGCPRIRRHAQWRNLGANVVWRFYRRVFRNGVTPTPFRVMRHQLARSVLFYRLNFTYLDGLLAWCTSRIGTLEVAHDARTNGRSGYSLGKLVTLALNLYTNFSLIPLQVVSALGFLTATAGFVVGMYYLLQFLASNIAVPGFASTIIAILILGGVQLLALGVIGEYVGRMHLNVNRKPQYLIREIEGDVTAPARGDDTVSTRANTAG